MATIFETTRQMITVAFLALPLMLISYTFFMGFGLGNAGLVILFLGQITVVPILAVFLQYIFGILKR